MNVNCGMNSHSFLNETQNWFLPPPPPLPHMQTKHLIYPECTVTFMSDRARRLLSKLFKMSNMFTSDNQYFTNSPL